jgi:hypothetical protein
MLMHHHLMFINSPENQLQMHIIGAHLCWATGFMFLISWRGYWQELMDIILYMHNCLHNCLVVCVTNLLPTCGFQLINMHYEHHLQRICVVVGLSASIVHLRLILMKCHAKV